MENKIQIKSIYGGVLFEYSKENNTIKDTLIEANKQKVDLSRADLSEADLYRVDLSETDLREANFYDAYLRYTYLKNVEYNERTTFFISQCPDGSFVGYKKIKEYIIKLLIPEDAKRSSATTLKCRCSKAIVQEIQTIDGEKSELKAIASERDENFIYEVGKQVEVKDFDEYRWNECSAGIHFFISRDAAVKY